MASPDHKYVLPLSAPAPVMALLRDQAGDRTTTAKMMPNAN